MFTRVLLLTILVQMYINKKKKVKHNAMGSSHIISNIISQVL